MDNLTQYIGQELTGKRVKELLNGMPLLKFMNDNDKHYNMIYKDGLNEDVLSFNPSNECSSGGIYITTLDNYDHFYDGYGNYAREVIIPDDARVYIEEDKMKCNKVILKEKKNKVDLLKDLFNKNLEISLKVIKQNGNVLRFIEQEFRTNQMMMEAVRQNGNALEYIKQ